MKKSNVLKVLCIVLFCAVFSGKLIPAAADSDLAGLCAYLGIPDKTYGYDIKYYGEGRDVNDFVETWNFTSEATNIQLDKDEFTTNGLADISMSFDLIHLPAYPSAIDYVSDDFIELYLLDPEGETIPLNGGTLNGQSRDNKYNDRVAFYPEEFQLGKNVLSVKTHFTVRGTYTFVCHISNINDSHDLGTKFYVKRPSVTAEDSLSTDKEIYKSGSSVPVTINYSVADDGYRYYMYIVRPDPFGNNKASWCEFRYDEEYLMQNHDWYSAANEMDISIGTVHSITENLNLSEPGTYAVVIYNLDLDQKTCVTTFLVSDTAADLNVDESSLVNGVVPFSCTSNADHLSLDSNDSITLEFQMPYGYYSVMSDINNYTNRDIIDYANIELSVYYTPVGSDSSRKIMKLKTLQGCLEKHTITLKASDILDAIISTNVNDSTYAGIVSVHFDYDDLSSLYAYLCHESFEFSVSKKSELVKVTAINKNVPREYGQYAGFKVESTAGGDIYADIYKGSKKVATVKGKSTLGEDADSNSIGTVYWNLKNSSGNYCAAGNYKAKVYTKTELVTVNGEDINKNTIKSPVKTVNFKIAKSTASLSLSCEAVSAEGGDYITYENPLVGVKSNVSVGSIITIKIKNPSGNVIKTYSYEQGKGTDTAWFNLSSLDTSFKIGTYSATVTAKTLTGATKSSTVKINVKKSPKVNISSTSLSTSDGIGTISFVTSQPSQVVVKLKDSKGNVKTNVVDKYYSSGTVKLSFAYGSLAVGTYTVSISATNSGGTSTDSRSFKINAKPVVVTKPTVSNCRIKWTKKNYDDALKIDVDYTGKGAKLYIEILWNDAEEIVYTYTTTTANTSGTISYTWDGYKANGFRAVEGSYTVRVYAVNSAGSTGYLRQNFSINAG